MMSRIRAALFGALAFVAALVASPDAKAGSSCQYITTGAVLTAAQWNSCFQAKQNELGYTPINKAGDGMTGLLTTLASTASTAGFRVYPGVAPNAPTNGDMWSTSIGFYVRVNGATVGPLRDGTSSSFAGTSPITVSFPSSVVTYAFDFSVANTFTALQTINRNAAAAQAAIAGTGLLVSPADGTVGRVQANAYGAIASFTGAIYAGTAAAPTQVLSGTQLTGVNAYAYTGSALVGPIASFRTYAAENITATAWGTKACISTTPSTTAVLTDGLCQQNSGGITIGSPTGGDKGVGTINSAGAIYINGTSIGTGPFLPLAGGTMTGGIGFSTTNTLDVGTSATVLAPRTVYAGTSFVGPVGTFTSTVAVGGCTIGANAFCATGSAAISSTLTSTAHTITSPSATALAVGLNGATNPALQVDASTAVSVTGLKVKSAALAGGLAVSVITSGTNENLTIDAAGSGTITFGGTSTGAIIHTRATTLSAALTYGGVALSNAVTGTGNMVLSAGPTFTGSPVLATPTATSLALGGCTIGANAFCATGTANVSGATTIGGALTYGGVTLSNAVTGTGNMVLSAGATLTGTTTTATLVATTLNGNTFTTGTYTLTGTAGKTLTFSNTLTLAGTDGTTMTFPSTSSTIPKVVASGTLALATGAISSGACTSAQTASATGTLTTDAITITFNGDPVAVTGYTPVTTGGLTIWPYPTADTFNAKVCNPTGASITPGAITLNFRVVR